MVWQTVVWSLALKKPGLWDCGMAFDIRVQNVLEKKTDPTDHGVATGVKKPGLTDGGVATGVTKFRMASGGLLSHYRENTRSITKM